MRRVLTLALSLPVVALITVQAFSQSPGSSTSAATGSPANPSPPAVHYHYHYHAPMSSTSYPPYSADPYYSRSFNASNPQAPPAFSPTQANPYPAGYIPGPFAPTGFQNFNPSAPSAQGVIDVFLPTKNAVVCLNGQKMRGTGKVRKFTTPVLPANQEYQYWVTATFNQNGESVTQYRKVSVGAGEYNVADFTRPPEENPIQLPAGPVNQNQAYPAQPE
jgi:uncharacterized protein (TIGR03000 family)